MQTFADVPFPARGLDLGRSYPGQAPGTTASAVNVRYFEPLSLRGRGGSRPGLSRRPAGQVLHGSSVLQDLNALFYTDALALASSFPPPELDPVTGLPPVVDPSTPGDPRSWGEGPPIDATTGDPAVDPVTGLPLPPFPTRNPQGGTPGGGTQPPRKVRDGGSGSGPNPNVLVYRPESGGPRWEFHGHVQIRIHKSPPDPLGWNGEEPEFIVDACFAYNPPLIPCPVDAFILGVSRRAPFLSIQQQIDLFLDGNNVRPCTYDVILNEVQCPPTLMCS